MRNIRNSMTCTSKAYRGVWLLLALLLLCGCAVRSEQPSQTEAAAANQLPVLATPAAGGDIRISMPYDAPTLNPLDVSTAEMTALLDLVYEKPVEIDEDGRIVPQLFESWMPYEAYETGQPQQSPDPQDTQGDDDQDPDNEPAHLEGGYVFLIREGVSWQGGAGQLDADDVLHTLDEIKQRVNDLDADTVYRGCIDVIEGYEKLGDGAVRITANCSLQYLLYHLDFPVLPQGQDVTMSPLGTGPYRVESYTPKQSMKLVRNADWWDERGVYIDSITALCTADDAHALAAYQDGGLDAVYTIDLTASAFRNTQEDTAKQAISRYYTYIAINHTHERLGALDIRKAIAYSLDKGELATRAFSRHGVMANVPSLPGNYYNATVYPYESLLRNEVTPLLQGQGFSDRDHDGIVEDAMRKPLTFKLLVSASLEGIPLADMAKTIERQLEKSGMGVEIVAVEKEEYAARLHQGDFDLALVHTYLPQAPDYGVFLAPEGALNYGGYAEASAVTLTDAVKKAEDEQDFMEAMNALNSYFMAEIPHIPVCFQTRTLLLRNVIQGVTNAPDPYPYMHIENWYVGETTE
ncbi:MAG: ABC transporter substrate-binding protein [Christensenellales bacterium]|jgi:ABC-type transport system substrate-binding protein